MVNSQHCERKQSWPILRYFSGIFLDGWEAYAQEPWPQGKSLKSGPSEYKAKALSCSIG